jgi:hypothetical protein
VANLRACANISPKSQWIVKPLEPPDRFHLEAAQGWLELGNHLEAEKELEQMSAINRARPDALDVR